MIKQKFSKFAVSGVLLFMLSFFNSCKQEETYSVATVETSQVTSITEASAACIGIITADGGSEVTSRGFCWSTSPIPTIENDTTIATLGTSSFSCSIKGLNPGTTYYVRAFAVNKGGVAYGLNEIFTTKTYSITTAPISISLLTATSAIGGGSIISDGDSSILTVKARGVCWNTFPSPTIENSKTSDGIGGGRFSSKMDSLTAFTTYYVRAYATNENGTIYGNEVCFSTLNGVVELTTNAVSSITAYTANSGGTVTSDGGSTVTERGICWNTSPNPTTENSKTINVGGTGTIVSNITGLTPSTTYYVKTYAINSVGTSYGNEVSFTTQSGIIGLTTKSVSSFTAYTAASGGTITSDGGAPITERGICWNTSPSPTTANNKTVNGSGTGNFTSAFTGLTPGTTYYVRSYGVNGVGTTYGNQVIFTSAVLVADIDGNTYNTVTIGTQTWMVENLKTTKYNDGTSIPLVSDATAWSNLSTPGYSWCNNDISYKSTNGALYNWYTLNTGKLAPSSWHVPTDAEWTTLENYLIANGYNYDGTTTGNKIAKSLAATTDWITSTVVGAIGNGVFNNNSSGFTGLPNGYRTMSGAFNSFGSFGIWWSSTEFGTNDARTRELFYINNYVIRNYTNKQCGFSVRCIRDY